MHFKGRTVLSFVLLAMFVSSILTLTIADPSILVERVGRGSTPLPKDSTLSSKDLHKISSTYDLIQNRYLHKADHDQLMNGAINGMLAVLDDPYTTYIDKNEAKQFYESINSTFQGIGAEVTSVDGKVTVVSPIKGSPAEKAGIHANDVIVTVNGEKLDGLTLNQAVNKIRGPKGTQARLGILRQGAVEPVEIIIVRDDIPEETVYAEMLDDQLGIIEIRQFSPNTSNRFKEELKSLEGKGMKGLIIDVRNNPGGILPVVVNIVEPFVPRGKAIVQLENRKGEREPTVSKGEGKTYPVTVLINKGTASASEILAGVVKEAVANGKVIGESSFGKGTVQVSTPLEDGSNIKMTEYKWLTPDGNWIDKIGIEPDIVIDQPDYFKATPFSRKNVLKKDMTGDEVKNLQVILSGLGFQPDRFDGYFSEKTSLALKAFQRLHNLPATGEVDDQTATQLELSVIEKIRNLENDLQLQAAEKHLKRILSK